MAELDGTVRSLLGTAGWLVRWGVVYCLACLAANAAWYLFLCRPLGSGIDACSLTNNPLEAQVAAVLVVALRALVRA
jgi:hypothetical protein